MSAPTFNIDTLMGLGILLRHAEEFVKQKIDIGSVRGIPDEDLEELGLNKKEIDVLRLRVWAFTKLGPERYEEQLDGVASLDLLEVEVNSIEDAVKLNKEAQRLRPTRV